jgi:hypothetical protein
MQVRFTITLSAEIKNYLQWIRRKMRCPWVYCGARYKGLPYKFACYNGYVKDSLPACLNGYTVVSVSVRDNGYKGAYIFACNGYTQNLHTWRSGWLERT